MGQTKSYEKSEILAKVKEIIADKLDVEIENIKETSKFYDDFCADSIDTLEQIVFFEREFNCTIPDEESLQMKTVQDAVDIIYKNLK